MIIISPIIHFYSCYGVGAHEVTKLLIRKGIDINAKSTQGRNAHQQLYFYDESSIPYT